MSEEMKKSVFSLFAQAQMTFAEAEEKAKQEAGKPKVERFRIGEDGEYQIRVLPIAPELDAEGNALPMERKGYEYPIHQLFLGINLPAKKGKKAKKINIPVIRSTDKGIDKSVDLIDTYVRIAKELYADDEDLLNVVTGGSFGGGLRWSYQHAMYVLDLTTDKSRAKGPQLWQCSHSQYRTLDDAKLRLWKELKEDDNQDTCPISWFVDAYPVKVIRKTEKKTEYAIEIGRKTLDVTEDEVQKLLELPRIPELVNRFTRYQMEAEIAFLEQYDELHQMDVCKEPDFIEAVEKLKGEMPADDTSHFDLSNAGSSKGGDKTNEVTIDSLWADYDHIVDEDLSEKSDEYQDLREKIRQFAEDNDLDVRLSRTKNNKQLLEEIEDAMEDSKRQSSVAAAPAAEPEETEEEEKEQPKEEAEKKAEEAPARRRRPRPTAETVEVEEEAETEEEPETAPAAPEAPAQDDAEERPIHRRRRR